MFLFNFYPVWSTGVLLFRRTSWSDDRRMDEIPLYEYFLPRLNKGLKKDKNTVLFFNFIQPYVCIFLGFFYFVQHSHDINNKPSSTYHINTNHKIERKRIGLYLNRLFSTKLNRCLLSSCHTIQLL